MNDGIWKGVWSGILTGAGITIGTGIVLFLAQQIRGGGGNGDSGGFGDGGDTDFVAMQDGTFSLEF